MSFVSHILNQNAAQNASELQERDRRRDDEQRLVAESVLSVKELMAETFGNGVFELKFKNGRTLIGGRYDLVNGGQLIDYDIYTAAGVPTRLTVSCAVQDGKVTAFEVITLRGECFIRPSSLRVAEMLDQAAA